MKIKIFFSCLAATVLCLMLNTPLVTAETPAEQDAIMKQVRVESEIGKELPLELTFQDESGNSLPLKSFFHSKPVILLPIYYECPMLCGLVLKGFLDAIKDVKFDAGKDFEIVAFSIDPGETPDLAKAKKETVIKEYGRRNAGEGWHFLSAPENESVIKALTDALGFRYAYDSRSGEYAHPAVIMMATPEGRVSHYFTGIEFSSKDLRLALIDASKKKLGNWIDQVFLMCYHYDPKTGKYGLLINNILRFFGTLTVLFLALFIGLSIKQDKNKK